MRVFLYNGGNYEFTGVRIYRISYRLSLVIKDLLKYLTKLEKSSTLLSGSSSNSILKKRFQGTSMFILSIKILAISLENTSSNFGSCSNTRPSLKFISLFKNSLIFLYSSVIKALKPSMLSSYFCRE